MCSVVWFIKVTRPLGLKGGGVGAAHAERGGVRRNLAFVVALFLCPESGSVEEGEGKPMSSCVQDEPQLDSPSFPLLWEEARLQFWPLSLTNSAAFWSYFHSLDLSFLRPR